MRGENKREIWVSRYKLEDARIDLGSHVSSFLKIRDRIVEGEGEK